MLKAALSLPNLPTPDVFFFNIYTIGTSALHTSTPWATAPTSRIRSHEEPDISHDDTEASTRARHP